MLFTQDWFSSNIPNWTAWLAAFKDRPVRFLEIGSYEGRATVWLLENILTHPDARIVCIDPYDARTHTTDTSIDLPEALCRFKENTEPWAAKIELLQGRSREELPGLTGLFDFIYVDGSHLSTDVCWDGVEAWPKLKPGGLLVFDDYFFNVPGWDDWKRTCHGIERALTQMAGHVILHKDHQVAVSKPL